MSVMDKLESGLNKYIGPVATKLNGSKIVKAMSSGMLATMPVMIGVALIAVLINLPIGPWKDFLSSTGLFMSGMLVLTVTLNMLGLYALIAVSYYRGKGLGLSPITSIVISVGIFLVLMPTNMVRGDEGTSFTLTTAYMGSSGFFLALLLGLIVPSVVNLLMKHMEFKMPETVPPMVVDSLSPTIVAITMFTIAALIKWAFTLTPFGDLFTLVNDVFATPIVNLGASPAALIILYTFASVLWFFGVHPSSITTLYSPVMSTVTLQAAEALVAGTEVPYISFLVVYLVMTIGGTGGCFGLSLNLLTAKSDRFKAIAKVAFIPSIFNISEPIMFGLPVVMNPTFFVPFVLGTPIVGAVAWVLSGILVPTFNASVNCPWIMPWPITAFLQGGVGACAIVLIAIAILYVLNRPFFLMADANALKEEQEMLAGAQAAKEE